MKGPVHWAISSFKLDTCIFKAPFLGISRLRITGHMNDVYLILLLNVPHNQSKALVPPAVKDSFDPDKTDQRSFTVRTSPSGKSDVDAIHDLLRSLTRNYGTLLRHG